MRKTTNLYGRLKLTKKATAEQVKKAYRKLAFDLHPDRNPNDDKAAAKFREVQEAFDVLSDEARRRNYDATGEWDANHRPAPKFDPQLIDFLHQSLAATFQSCLEAHTDPDKVDFVDMMKRMIEMKRTETRKQKKDLVKGREKLAKVLGRYKTDEEDNLLESLTKQSVANMDKGIEQMDKDLSLCDRALEVLSKYKFDVNKPEFGFGSFGGIYDEPPTVQAKFKAIYTRR